MDDEVNGPRSARTTQRPLLVLLFVVSVLWCVNTYYAHGMERDAGPVRAKETGGKKIRRLPHRFVSCF